MGLTVSNQGWSRAIGSSPDELTLVEAARTGDRGALDTLLRAHYDRIYSICRRMAGNDADAADATQEALIAIARGIARFDGRSAFSTWTYRIATNACLDELRRRRRRPDPGLPEDHQAEPRDHEATIDQAVAEKDALDAALAGLREEYRAPVVLRDLGGFDYAEIAAILDLRPGTVRSRIARGRAALATVLSLGNQQADNDVQADDHA